jgi:hypothetical protein
MAILCDVLSGIGVDIGMGKVVWAASLFDGIILTPEIVALHFPPAPVQMRLFMVFKLFWRESRNKCYFLYNNEVCHYLAKNCALAS